MMRKGLLLLAGLVLVAAAPSATFAQKAKGGSEFVGDALSQAFVPFQSLAQGGHSAAPAKATKSKRAKKKARKSGKAKKKS
jgi:hypothetical protein